MSNGNSDYFTEMVKLITGLGAVAIVAVLIISWFASLFSGEPEQDQAAVNERLKSIEVVAIKGAPAPVVAAKPAAQPKTEAKAEPKPESKPETKQEVKQETAQQPAAAEKSADAGASDNGMGKIIYTQTCFACHGTGLLNSPKKGDAAEWKKRADALGGIDGLVKSAIVGKGAMPAKGGATNLDEDGIRAAVEYMMK